MMFDTCTLVPALLHVLVLGLFAVFVTVQGGTAGGKLRDSAQELLDNPGLSDADPSEGFWSAD